MTFHCMSQGVRHENVCKVRGKMTLLLKRSRVRLGNPDLDLKIWIFGFTIEHKIRKRISRRILLIEILTRHGFPICESATKSVFRFSVRLSFQQIFIIGIRIPVCLKIHLHCRSFGSIPVCIHRTLFDPPPPSHGPLNGRKKITPFEFQ